ncbi:prenyltransferase/squalene oxidase repeat-containing protein [Streptomyces sp. HD]|uniref:prenyltransferase/squalene oxidase repeat-containing protein n=1 Tax=Streptomyces sp. HD TaxID=3020892 RepID=UPI002330B55F|nr:prenyltransferase/squalene oxidase repeat-containing protein [Streptomyces sp. HD]MDC0768263.1 terpene cyclase/mutase family protein [Streptomyces sp. HD]
MYVRRSAAVLAAVTVIGVATPVAQAATASPSASLPAGLYGTTDPTYDGVWRQSLALLAQDTVGVKPAAAAVDWLTGQQCANGAFAPFRADTGKGCDAKTAVDTNSTAAAVQALAALGGQDAATGKAVTWLKSVQNKDGGWGYFPGGPSDANSTSLVAGALTATGAKPADVVKGGKSPYDALLTFALPCDAAGGGAFAFQPDKKGKLAANADATAAAVVAALGKTLTGAAPKPTGSALTCKDATDPEQAAQNGAAYLVKALAKDDHLLSTMPGAKDQPDYGNTADAVLALSTAGHGEKAADAMRWLGSHYQEWAKQAGPAAYAQLILAADGTGFDVRDFDGTGDDLVKRLNATGPAPESVPAVKSPTASDEQKKADADDDNGVGVWWIVGVCLVAGIGVGFLLSGRNKGRRK